MAKGIGELLLSEGGLKSREVKRLFIYRVGKNMRAAETAPEGVEVLGEVGIRQPSLDDIEAISGLKGAKSDAEAVIRCSFDPSTNKPLFDETASESLRENAAGTWVTDVARSVAALIPKAADRAELGKGSAETPASA